MMHENIASIFQAHLDLNLNEKPQVNSLNIGGFLVCLNVPEGTLFGIDYEVFRTGPKFQGLKFIPLGIHFVVFLSKDHEHGVRQGFFINVERHMQVLVKEWSFEKEEFVDISPIFNYTSLEKSVLNFELDGSLGAYPKQHQKTWRRLSCFLTQKTLKRSGINFGTLIMPGDPDEQLIDDNATTTSTSSATKEEERVIPFFSDFPRTARFTSLDAKKKNASNLPTTLEERTRYFFDRSQQLEELLSSEYEQDWKELMGEFQLTFVLFLLLSSFSALEQWKKLIVMLCSCEEAIHQRPDLFCAFIQTLCVHLEQIPCDFFEDELTNVNFFRSSFASFFELLDDNTLHPKLLKRTQKLLTLIQNRFGLFLEKEEKEEEENAPVVVILPQAKEEKEKEEEKEEQKNKEIALAFLQQLSSR